MKYLVTSATGDLAKQATEKLVELVGPEQVVVTVRSLDKAQSLVDLGVEVRQADYLDEASLVAAFEGINRVLFISSGDLTTRAQQHTNVVQALVKAGVDFVAYTSAPNAPKSTAIVAPDHQLTERLIEESGIAHAFLRNNWYIENEAGLIGAIKGGYPFAYSAGEGKTGWALKKDYAEAAARVLADVAPKQVVYELGGTPLTYPELVQALGATVQLVPVTDEENAEQLQAAGVPAEAIGFVVGVQKDIRDGQLDVSSSDLETALGRPQTALSEIL